MTLDIDRLMKILVSTLSEEQIIFNEIVEGCTKLWQWNSKSFCVSKAVFFWNPEFNLGPSFQFTLWPSFIDSPALLATLNIEPNEQDVVVYTVQLELLFQAYINEDDAMDWHAFLQVQCDELNLSYSDAKSKADKLQFNSMLNLYRGIGGVCLSCQSFELASSLLLKSIDMYVSLLQRSKATSSSSKLEYNPCFDFQRSMLFQLLKADPRLHPSLYPSCELILSGEGDGASAKQCHSLEAVRISPRSTYKEPLLIQALRGVSVPRPPVWLHRQAGRYLPEYRELKGTKNFLELTGDPCIAAEITMQPVRRYQVDAAIIFSDIMTIPIALGLEVKMQPGPFLPNPVTNDDDIDKLMYVPERLTHVYEALNLVKAQLDKEKALVGFCGGPFTLLYYMVRPACAVKDWLEARPEGSHRVLTILAEVAIDYLYHQVIAGADALQIFESHAGDLSLSQFKEFSFPYLDRIARGVKKLLPHVPIVVFPRGMPHEAMALLTQRSVFDGVALDSTWSPLEARQAAGEAITLQGNFPPEDMYLPYDEIREKVSSMIQHFGKNRYVVNLGHGTLPDMDPEAVRVFVETAQTIQLGTRASPLAIAQSQLVADRLIGIHRIQFQTISTQGDEVLDRSISKIGDKGVFTKELDAVLLAKKVDLVQHSFKDMETQPTPGLKVVAILPRADRRDALVSYQNYTLDNLPLHAKVGTSALRRKAQLAALRPDLTILDVRGNIQTRLQKLKDQHYDALIMAMAGLTRLSLNDPQLCISPLMETDFIPAAGQGAVAVQVRADDLGLIRWVASANDPITWTASHLEREVLHTLHGGCQAPIGVYTKFNALDQWEVHAHVWSKDGQTHVSAIGGTGKEAAQRLIELGVDEILTSSRQLD